MGLTAQQEKWASKSRQGVPAIKLRELLIKQNGRCALSGVRMIFDKKEGTPVSGGKGCHPLYPSIDHIDPGNAQGGYQIICYALNDLKGHIPRDCFEALTQRMHGKILCKGGQNRQKIMIKTAKHSKSF